ncbi:MAG: glycosyltransferase [Ignavibacteriales bacterium]|nr:glycosyltransferase [Ignavibacteriales bacterium]
MNQPEVSLIISFYNRIDFLKLVFAGLKRQTFKNFEVIIADDGSKEEVVNEIEKLSREINFPIAHIWQEDKGFRKNKILNQAIVNSNSTYLIFIDGDCIPHRDFISEHFSHRQLNICLTGRRVNLSQKLSESLSTKKVKEGILENQFFLLKDGLLGKSTDVEKGFFIRNKFLRKYFNKKKRGLLGCNFSIYKNDLLIINGFDERYIAPSIGEDSDVQFRLELAGVRVRSLNNIAVQYHLYHKLQPRPIENLRLFETVKTEKQAFSKFGIK